MSLVDRHADYIEHLAGFLGCEARSLRAVIRVEAGSEGLVDNRPKIRLEVHHLWRNVPAELRPRVDANFLVGGPRPWEGHQVRIAGLFTDMHQPGAVGQSLEWTAFGIASGIHYESAVASTSWGAGQVLGRYWRETGYDSPEEFVKAQYAEREQLRCMVMVIRDVAKVADAIAVRDWAAFARGYNGSGQVEWYAGKLAQAYERS